MFAPRYVGGMGSRRGLLPDDLRHAAQEALRVLVAKAGSEPALAQLLSVSQQAINKGRKYGEVGPHVLRQLLEHLGGITETELMARFGVAEPKSVVAPLRREPAGHSERDKARAFAVMADFHPDVIAEVDRIKLAPGVTLDRFDWIEKYVDATKERRGSRPFIRDRSNEVTDPGSEERIKKTRGGR